MSVHRTTAAYDDCFRVMDQMLRKRGGAATFESYKKAVIFRHRCYRARKLLFTAAERAVKPGTIPSTPYDDIYIQLVPDSPTLTFRLRSRQPLPDLSFADPERTPDEDDPSEDDPLDL